MKLEIVQHGGAVALPSRTVPLCDLVPPSRLDRGNVHLVDALPSRPGYARLLVSDGTWLEVSTECPAPRATADLLLTGADQVLTMEGSDVGLRDNVVVLCGGDRILAVGDPEDPAVRRLVTDSTRVVDVGGGVLTPGLVDPHTHPVFFGHRAEEFGLKAAGATYLEIHNAGGGILSTVRSVRGASFDELLSQTLTNLTRLLRWGVTTCEGKSGYDLTVGGELRMLDVLRAAGDRHPVDVEPSLLGAHALPPEYADNRTAYVDRIVEKMIPSAADEGLARFCDAYCEQGAFTVDEVARIFEAASRAGLTPRLHAEQFTHQGGAELAARMGAASADHLEAVSTEGIEALAQGDTVAVLLPGAALTCRCPWPPARALLDAGAQVALGTDFNPGSSLTSSLPLMMSLACMQMGMSCDEAWRAVTVEAAAALRRDDIGRLAAGARADIAVFDVPDYRYVPYHYGDNHLKLLYKNGDLVVNRRGG